MSKGTLPCLTLLASDHTEHLRIGLSTKLVNSKAKNEVTVVPMFSLLTVCCLPAGVKSDQTVVDQDRNTLPDLHAVQTAVVSDFLVGDNCLVSRGISKGKKKQIEL